MLERRQELSRLHVVGIRVELLDAPSGVRNFGQAFAAAAPQIDKMAVIDSRCRQARRQGFLTELRMPPRAGKSPNVGQQLDVARREQFQQLIDRPRGMADGPDGGRLGTRLLTQNTTVQATTDVACIC